MILGRGSRKLSLDLASSFWCTNGLIIKSMENTVINLLENSKVAYTLGSYPTETKTAADAAKIMGVSLDAMAKTLLFQIHATTYALVLVSCSKTVNMAKARTILGKSCELAKKEVVESITGYPIGIVTPFGLKQSIPVYVDTALMDYTRISTGSGQKGVEILIAPQDLVKLTNAQIVDLI